jgi:predicted transcriptional regulator
MTEIHISFPRYAIEHQLLKQNYGYDSGWPMTDGAKRGRFEILAGILLFCGDRKTKTSIMYKTNLNYAQMQNHLRLLTKQGLLTMDKSRYITTDKGRRFAELFIELNGMLKEEETAV